MNKYTKQTAKDIALGFVTAVLIMLAIGAVIFGVFQERSNSENTWGESAEFTQLESGQDRFSLHNSNIADNPIIVDHSTGIMYMRGIGVLVDENGEPLKVLEVGE